MSHYLTIPVEHCTKVFSSSTNYVGYVWMVYHPIHDVKTFMETNASSPYSLEIFDTQHQLLPRMHGCHDDLVLLCIAFGIDPANINT